jgi:hypothetical protein
MYLRYLVQLEYHLAREEEADVALEQKGSGHWK